MKVNLQDVVQAIENNSDETRAYYHTQKEEVIYYYNYALSDNVIDFEAEEQYLISLPTKYEVNDYHNMELYIETLDDPNIREWLSNAIRGRGAFRMFRAAVDRFGLTNEWYVFLDKKHRALAMEWCEEHGIEYDTDLYSEEDDEDDFDEDTEEYYDEAPAVNEEEKTDIRIVRITKKNAANIHYMNQGFHDESFRSHCESKYLDLEDSIREIDTWLDQQDHVYASSVKGRFVAFMDLQERDDMLILKRMYVRQDFRRKGVGTALFHKAEEISEEIGADDLVIDISPRYEAMLEFLKKMGYAFLSSMRVSRNKDSRSPADSHGLQF